MAFFSDDTIKILRRVRYSAYIFIRAGENSSQFRRDSCYAASAVRSIDYSALGVVVVYQIQVYWSGSYYVSVDCDKDDVEGTS